MPTTIIFPEAHQHPHLNQYLQSFITVAPNTSAPLYLSVGLLDDDRLSLTFRYKHDDSTTRKDNQLGNQEAMIWQQNMLVLLKTADNYKNNDLAFTKPTHVFRSSDDLEKYGYQIHLSRKQFLSLLDDKSKTEIVLAELNAIKTNKIHLNDTIKQQAGITTLRNELKNSFKIPSNISLTGQHHPKKSDPYFNEFTVLIPLEKMNSFEHLLNFVHGEFELNHKTHSRLKWFSNSTTAETAVWIKFDLPSSIDPSFILDEMKTCPNSIEWHKETTEAIPFDPSVS